MARRKGPNMDQAYQYILNKILSYELLPGSPISDSILAEELGMSRAPVRDAIFKLTSEGLIENINGKTSISNITLEDIREILEVRNAIETRAAQLIIEHGGLTSQQQAELSQVFQNLQNTVDSNKFSEHYKHDDLFHLTIIRFSKNRRFTEISDRMHLQMTRARWLNVVLPIRKYDAAKEHQEIYDAMVANDFTRSMSAIELHYRNTYCSFKEVLENPEYKMMITSINSIFRSSHTTLEDS